MKRLCSYHFLCRTVTLAVLVAGAAAIAAKCLVSEQEEDIRFILNIVAVLFICSSFILCCNPLPGDDPKKFFFLCGTIAAVSCLLLCSAVFLPSWIVMIQCLAGFLATVAVIRIILRVRGSLMRTRLILHGGLIWQILSEGAAAVHLAVLLLIFAAWNVSFGREDAGFPVLLSAVLALSAVFYCLKYWSVWSGRTLLVSAARERTVKGASRDACSLRPELPPPSVDDELRTNVLYNRILDVMEQGKPYLDPNLELGHFSMMVLSNKVSVSKAINTMSGMHFCAFINVYRIEYAKNLIRRDKRLKILEVSDMCGFNSTVSFNNAFKINTGMTPTDFKEMYGGRGETETEPQRQFPSS